MRQVVSYIRVSTTRQGRSGLGLEAQRQAVARFAEAEGLEIVAEHVEVETGKGQAKKARGVFLGNRTNLGEAQALGASANRAAAQAFAANVLPIIHQLQAAGVTTLRGVANTLNTRGVRSARGGAWQSSSVRNVLARAKSASARRVIQ